MWEAKRDNSFGILIKKELCTVKKFIYDHFSFFYMITKLLVSIDINLYLFKEKLKIIGYFQQANQYACL